MEAHFANNYSKVLTKIRQFFLNCLAVRAEGDVTNFEQVITKKWKLNNGQKKIFEFHESIKLSEDRIHKINWVCIKVFVVCDIVWYAIENPFFIEFLKTLCLGYVPPSKEVLSGKLLLQETVVVNIWVTDILKNATNLTLCKIYNKLFI